jgi:hypothetical protein
MGFDPAKIPVLNERHLFADPGWGRFEMSELCAELDGREERVVESGLNFEFVPPPGWRGHIER